MTRKAVIAYSGTLEASALLRRLKETLNVPIVAVVPDLGQPEDAGAISRRAAKAGADKAVIADLRDELARDGAFTALKAGALLEVFDDLPRPFVAKVLLRVAKSEGADAAAAGPGLELPLRALAPELEILSPGRSAEFKTRAELLAFAAQRGIEGSAAPWADETQLLGAVYEGGPLDDPWAEPPAELFRLTADPAKAPDEPGVVEIEFADGVPTAVDKESLAPAKLIQRLNELAGRHGVGRADVVEPRFAGLKARRAREAPGIAALDAARKALESLACDPELLRQRDALTPAFAALVREGLWFSPEMNALRAYVEEARKGVTGSARIRLFKGSASVVGRKSPNSLYNPELAGTEAYAGARAADAGGYVRVSGLRLSLNKSLRRSV